MSIGVICEGHTDRAVISNLLKGLKGVDSSDIIPIRPIDSYDNTDLAAIEPDTFGGWDSVKSECESRDKIQEFLSISGNDYIVIHLDSDIASEIGINIPDKSQPDYSKLLREEFIKEIQSWLENQFTKNIIHAIAVESIEAWVLTIHQNSNTTNFAKPKERLSYVLKKKGLSYQHTYKGFLKITSDFKKSRKMRSNSFASKNESLLLFCLEVGEKIRDE